MQKQISLAEPSGPNTVRLGKTHGLGSYERKLQTTTGEVTMKVPKVQLLLWRRRSSNATGGEKARWKELWSCIWLA
jgi:hypothetical protein